MRKLAISAGAFSFAVLITVLLPGNAFFPAMLAGGVCFLSGVFSLILGKTQRVRIFRLAALFLSAGFVFSGIWCRERASDVSKLEGKTRQITAVLTDWPVHYDTSVKAEGVITAPGLPRLRILIYDYSPDSRLSDAEPGQEISFTSSFKSADKKYGENYDTYKSEGIALIATAESEIAAGAFARPLRSVPVRIRKSLEEAVDTLFPSTTSAFMKSLLVGSRKDFYQNTEMNLSVSRAGIMHIVAISGMHIAFLIGFVQLIFGRTKRSAVFCLMIVWLFVFVTGAGPSAVRAAVMQSVLLFAPIFRRENDPLTSLSLALALILIFNPYAVLSVSLQLSFAAMAGIIFFGERLYRFLLESFSRFAKLRLMMTVFGIIASSLSVMALTLPFTALYFGEIQILSVLTNIFVLWAVSLCFCGGYLSLLLALCLPWAGSGLARGISLLVEYILSVAEKVSSVSWAVIYISDIFAVLWLILVYLFFLGAVFSNMDRYAKIFLPPVLTAVSLFIFLLVTKEANRSYRGVITALDVGQGQCIAVFCGDKTAVIDCGGINTLSNAGETAGEYLLSAGRDKVDFLIFTHLHEDHANGTETLLALTGAEKILVPEYPEEDASLTELRRLAEKYGAGLTTISNETYFRSGDLEFALYPPEEMDEDNENCMGVIISIDDTDLIVTGDMNEKGERSFLERSGVADAEILAVSHHGSRYSSGESFLRETGCRTALISCGYNTYGHPAQETIDRLQNAGYTVYRTDCSGNIRLIVN